MQHYLSCDSNGVLSVGPNADSVGSGEIVLPDCSNWDAATKTPICDRTELGVFSIDYKAGFQEKAGFQIDSQSLIG